MGKSPAPPKGWRLHSDGWYWRKRRDHDVTRIMDKGLRLWAFVEGKKAFACSPDAAKMFDTLDRNGG